MLQPAHIRTLSDEAAKALTPEISVALLFQCSKAALEGVQGQAIFGAIQDTLNCKLGDTPDSIELYKVLLHFNYDYNINLLLVDI